MIDDCHLSGWSESGEVLMKSQKKSVDRSKRIITDRDMSVLKDFVQLIPKLIATHYDFDGNQNTPS